MPLDVAASGVNVVAREGISIRHPTRFVLIGSGNPEEGELRPQLLDRFGLAVQVTTLTGVAQQVLVVRRRQAYEADTAAFLAAQEKGQEALRRHIRAAQRALPAVELPDPILFAITDLCVRLGVDGHRGELPGACAAPAVAAFRGHGEVGIGEVISVAVPALKHRLRKDPLEECDGGERVTALLADRFGPETVAEHAALHI